MTPARFTSRYALWIVVVWLVCAGGANLLVPQLERVVQTHSRSFPPADASSTVAASAAAELFGQQRNNNFNYVVLERDQSLIDRDRQVYDRLIAASRADSKHVVAVTDLWADPATADEFTAIDTLVVRTFVLPSLIALLGRWFWWPSWKATRRVRTTAPARGQSTSRATLLR